MSRFHHGKASQLASACGGLKLDPPAAAALSTPMRVDSPEHRGRAYSFSSALQRSAAIVCLFGCYQMAVTGFAVSWMALSLVAAAVTASARPYWIDAATAEPALLLRPQGPGLWAGMLPGWSLMCIAAAAKAMHMTPQTVHLVWLAGVLFLLGGAWIASHRLPGPPAASTTAVWLWAAIIVIAAAALRSWDIGTVPRYVHCDEYVTSRAGQLLLDDPRTDWFAPLPHSGAYAMMNLSYALAGIGMWLGGVSVTTARIPDVVLGTLSVWLLFDGLRRVTTLRLAVTAALLLSVNHCHIAFSRISSQYIQSAFVVALAFNLFARLWTAPTYLNAALLGLAVALGIQTYRASSVLLPLILVAMAALVLVRPSRLRTMRVSLMVFALTCVTAGGVFGVALWQNWDEMMVRSRDINIFAPAQMEHLKRVVYHTDSAAQVVLAQAWNSLRGFHLGRDTQPQYGINAPMSDPYAAALMIPGALLLALRVRHFAAINAWVFTAGFLLLGLGLQYAPGHNRTTGALPLGMVFAATTLVHCAALAWDGDRRWRRAAVALTLAGGIGLSAWANLQLYFVDYRHSLLIGDAGSEAGWAARAYADRYAIHPVSWNLDGEYRHEGLRLITSGLPLVRNTSDDTARYVAETPVTGADLFIVHEDDAPGRDAVLARFPQARVEEWIREPNLGPKLTLVFVEGQP